ncbi:peroxidase [Nilaparvata lugens]|uniref:peroxidase n=1 Tax=Nilaparvata lugens TaxID=108931 RepID=UPI00193D3FD5|nr:peroxidase [Nilaparvata lugens]
MALFLKNIAILVSLVLVGAQQNQQPFRTTLFDEQTQQAALMIQQNNLNQQIQELNRHLQVATANSVRENLLKQQVDLNRRLQEMQLEQQRLQIQLQEQLMAGSGISVKNGQQQSRIVNQQAEQFRPTNNNQIAQKQVTSPQQVQLPPFEDIFQEPFPEVNQQQNFNNQQQTFQSRPNNQQNFQQAPVNQQTFQQSFPQQQRPNNNQQSFQQQRPNNQQFQSQIPPQSPFTQSVSQTSTSFGSSSSSSSSSSFNGQTPLQSTTNSDGPTCSTLSGEAGRCRPLVNCLSFYAELPELRRQPCRLRSGELGVCCPTRSRPVGFGGFNSGVLAPPPPPPVVIPPLTPQQLNGAASAALQQLRDRLALVQSLFENRIVVAANTPAAAHQEFFPVTNATLVDGQQAQKNVDASIGLVNEFKLSPEQGTFALPRFSVLNTIIADTCPQVQLCDASKYRTADGSCNNLSQDRWGKAGTALHRILPPKYQDGVSSPRTRAANGVDLPSARIVSSQLAQEKDVPSNNYTLMVMQWGQFLDHDLTHTPISKGQSGSGISCCRDGKVIDEAFRHPDCFTIDLPLADHIFSPFGERCMEFVRSLPAPRPECNFGPREQMNQVSGFLDASNIYGSSVQHQQSLREFQGGRLRTQNVKGRHMLPANRDECTSDNSIFACFRAGDGRVNEQLELALMHTIWMREHNRVARSLQQQHPNWSDEALFQEARRIVVAEMQHITYNEFLPIVLGREYMDKFELSPQDKGHTALYDASLNPGITNVFATAAFRFGHSLIQSHMHGYGRFGNVRSNLTLSRQHFNPFILYNDGAVDDFIRGLSTQPAQKFDRFFSKEVTDHLFQGDLDFGLDLFALNIQRGRDHGLPPYNDWREVCALPRAVSWEDLARYIDTQSVQKLRSIYGSVDEIDLFSGAVAEKPTGSAILGPTFVCLVGDQFARLRRGDSFFYEEGGQSASFTEEQLSELRHASLSRILCDNSDDIFIIQPLAFVQPSFLNQRVACDSESIPKVDLKAWKDENPGVF